MVCTLLAAAAAPPPACENDFTFVRPINRGAHSLVHLVLRRDDNSYWALKVMSKDKSRSRISKEASPTDFAIAFSPLTSIAAWDAVPVPICESGS